MRLSDELKQWGYHASLSEGGLKQHLEMADKAAKLEAKGAALQKAARRLVESITDNDLEAVKAQWGVNINTVWKARDKLIALLEEV